MTMAGHLRKSAIGVIERDEGGQRSIGRCTENGAEAVETVGALLGSSAVEITTGIHGELALWIGAIGSIGAAVVGPAAE